MLLLLLPGGRAVMRLLGVSIFKQAETMFFYDVVRAKVSILVISRLNWAIFL